MTTIDLPALARPDAPKTFVAALAGRAAAVPANPKAALGPATVTDVGRNGLDSGDVEDAAARVKAAGLRGLDVGRALAADGRVIKAKVVLLGELHGSVPLGVQEGLLRGAAARGRATVLAVELPPAGEGGRPGLQAVADRWNGGEIAADSLGTELVRALQSDAGLRGYLAEPRDNLAAEVLGVVRAAQAGAKIRFIDSGRAGADAALRAGRAPAEGRDAAMARQIEGASRDAPPGALVVAQVGLAHAQGRPGLTSADASGTNPPGFVDLADPLGAKLKRKLGKEGTLSTAVLPGLVPLFMRGTPISSWDLVLHDPDTASLPDWLDGPTR